MSVQICPGIYRFEDNLLFPKKLIREILPGLTVIEEWEEFILFNLYI
jgi:hypothetical protein